MSEFPPGGLFAGFQCIEDPHVHGGCWRRLSEMLAIGVDPKNWAPVGAAPDSSRTGGPPDGKQTQAIRGRLQGPSSARYPQQ